MAGVSQSTVSKALNDRHDVGEATRKRVLQIAREHHFTPNAFGKALKRQTTENIGVVFCREPQPLSSNPFYSRVLEGIEGELAVKGYNLILNMIAESAQHELPKMVRERQVDGLILAGTFSREYMQDILQTEIPAVLVDPKISDHRHNQILIDNQQGAYLMTEYLIRRGHRQIAFISGELERQSFCLRYQGYKKALKKHGIPLNEELVRTGGVEMGYDLVMQVLKTRRPTAIFSANDINAVYGYKAIAEMGLKVPWDISVTGFEDIDLAKHATPPLTTVRVYKEELGSLAVRTLLRSIQGLEKQPVTTVVPVRLVERESVRDIQAGSHDEVGINTQSRQKHTNNKPQTVRRKPK